MNLLYDQQRQRICLSWKDPVKAKFQGKDIIISKKRTRSVRVSKRGKICKADVTKFNDPRQVKEIVRFCRELEEAGAFGRLSAGQSCHICGNEDSVRALMDEKTGKLVWLCPVHMTLYEEPNH